MYYTFFCRSVGANFAKLIIIIIIRPRQQHLATQLKVLKIVCHGARRESVIYSQFNNLKFLTTGRVVVAFNLSGSISAKKASECNNFSQIVEATVHCGQDHQPLSKTVQRKMLL